MNNNLNKLKPFKILGKGSEGVVILTHDNRYSVKIYRKNPNENIMLINIIHYFLDTDLPKTIYTTYIITSRKNSLNRYITNNTLPNYFSYINLKNYETLSNKYKMKTRIFEVMKTYKYTLDDFIKKNLLNHNIKISFLQQGILTLLWLYMEKSIIHGDLNANNFFIQKTNKNIFSIKIRGEKFDVKLYGYYIIFGDFGYAKSIELIDSNKFPEQKKLNILSQTLNPWFDVIEFINLFNNELNINIDELSMKIYMKTNNLFREMLKSYIKNESSLHENIIKFKDTYFEFIKNNIIYNKFLNI
jgi:hypothetical protein